MTERTSLPVSGSTPDPTPRDESVASIEAEWLSVCPLHGILSEREACDAFEMGVDYWGESCGPYGCPLIVAVPVPTTADRTRPKQGFIRIVEGDPPPTFGTMWTDPGWTSVECGRELRDHRYVRADS